MREGTAVVGGLINLHLLTGQIGKPGAGPFSLTGQPNAMGGREVGGLANQLAGSLVGLPADWPDGPAGQSAGWQSGRLAGRLVARAAEAPLAAVELAEGGRCIYFRKFKQFRKFGNLNWISH